MSLKVTINAAGTITIKIGASALKKAALAAPHLESYDEKSGRQVMPCIPDAKLFAKEVFIALNDEQEDGTTPVHTLFDNAFERLVNVGSESILLPGDTGYKKRYAD